MKPSSEAPESQTPAPMALPEPTASDIQPMTIGAAGLVVLCAVLWGGLGVAAGQSHLNRRKKS